VDINVDAFWQVILLGSNVTGMFFLLMINFPLFFYQLNILSVSLPVMERIVKNINEYYSIYNFSSIWGIDRFLPLQYCMLEKPVGNCLKFQPRNSEGAGITN